MGTVGAAARASSDEETVSEHVGRAVAAPLPAPTQPPASIRETAVTAMATAAAKGKALKGKSPPPRNSAGGNLASGRNQGVGGPKPTEKTTKTAEVADSSNKENSKNSSLKSAVASKRKSLSSLTSSTSSPGTTNKRRRTIGFASPIAPVMAAIEDDADGEEEWDDAPVPKNTDHDASDQSKGRMGEKASPLQFNLVDDGSESPCW